MQSAVRAAPLKTAPAPVSSAAATPDVPPKNPPPSPPQDPAPRSADETLSGNKPASYVPPKLIKRVEPVYSGSKLRGTVRLSLFVTQSGNVRTIKVIRRLDTSLDRNAIQAVSQWRYQPALIDGRPAIVQITEDVAFPPK
jgi:periplasmic protein TonB